MNFCQKQKKIELYLRFQIISPRICYRQVPSYPGVENGIPTRKKYEQEMVYSSSTEHNELLLLEQLDDCLNELKYRQQKTPWRKDYINLSFVKMSKTWSRKTILERKIKNEAEFEAIKTVILSEFDKLPKSE